MNKKLLSIILAFAMLFTSVALLASCNDTEKETESESVSSTESETSTEKSTESEKNTESDKATESDKETESQSASESDNATESQSASESDNATESQGASESGSETDASTESDTSASTSTDTGSDTSTATETESAVSTDTNNETDPVTAPATDPVTEPATEPNLDDTLYENGDTIKDAGTQWDEEVFALTENEIDESKAQDITAAELLILLQNKDALTSENVYRVKDPLVLSSDTKYYGNLASVIAEGGIVIDGVNSVVVKELIIKGNITITNSKSITFFKIDVKGSSTAISIDENSSIVALKNCKVYATDVAVDAKADSLSIYRNYLSAAKGLVSTGDSLAIQDSQIVAIDLGISSSGEECTVKNNVIELASTGVGVDFIAGSRNGLIALNVIKDAQISVRVTEGYNCVVLLNSAIRVIGENNTNLYVVENKLGGAIELRNNQYLLCDSNSFKKDGKAHPVVNTNNTEYNGDNLHDVNARVEYGANEELLPHTNKDLFIGMERHSKVRDVSLTKSYTFNNYIRTMGRKNSIVIVPPGAYRVSTHLSLDATHSNTTVYAYGVYEEKDSLEQLLTISSTSNVSVQGLTLGYVHQSAGQVYVLEKLDNQKLRVVTNAGYINDFGQSNLEIFNSGMCDAFWDEYLYPWATSVSYKFVEKCDDGTMILQFTGNAKQFSTIGVGDIFGCRLAGDNSRSIYIQGKNVKLKDCVLYGYAAALAIVSGGDGNENLELERLHNTVHSGYEISEETYNWYKSLEEQYGADLEVYIDEQGRYRGGLPRIGSVDATHIAGGNIGVNATSCLFESMCDDGSNQRGSSGRLAGYQDNGNGTTTLYFKGTLSQTYHGIHTGKGLTSTTPTEAHAPKAGDKVLVYATDGHIAFHGNVLDDAVKVGADLPTCNLDHTETENRCWHHIYHTDANNDCVCDDETCKALMHYDISTNGAGASARDGKCDKCGIKVYIDYNSNDGYAGVGNNRCDLTGLEIVDEDVDGIDDVSGTPIIRDMAQHTTYEPGSSRLYFRVYYTYEGVPTIIQYYSTLYKVTVKTSDVDFEAFDGYDLTDNDYFMNQKVMFDNQSRNSAGFVFDNVVVQRTRSRGILVKTVDSTIKNCTFRNHGMTSILLSVETTWGESTVPSNITVESCLFDNTGCIMGYEANLTQAPIAIQGLGNLSGSVEVSEETLPCKNIKIIGNKFVNTNNNYCITMSAAQGITIKDNVFTAREGDNEKKYGRAVFINGCANITISNNTYSEIIDGDVTKAVIGYNYIGLGGTDVVDGEGNRLLPEQKDPQ